MSEMVANVPALTPIYLEHRANYDDVLPHVLMGEVARFALKSADEHQAAQQTDSSLTQLLRVLEQGIQSTQLPIRELIVASFLENLDETEPGYRPLTSLFGSALRRAMTRLHGGDPW